VVLLTLAILQRAANGDIIVIIIIIIIIIVHVGSVRTFKHRCNFDMVNK